jgi:hypothetical protein
MHLFELSDHTPPFCVRIVEKGDSYGYQNCLTHEKDTPLVEFYDRRYPHTDYGQFVARYDMATFMGHGECGLDLHGGIPEWKVTAEGIRKVRAWISEIVW